MTPEELAIIDSRAKAYRVIETRIRWTEKAIDRAEKLDPEVMSRNIAASSPMFPALITPDDQILYSAAKLYMGELKEKIAASLKAHLEKQRKELADVPPAPASVPLERRGQRGETLLDDEGKMTHSPEPWKECCDECSAIDDAHGETVATAHLQFSDEDESGEVVMKANKERIVACVNACHVFSTDEILVMGTMGFADLARSILPKMTKGFLICVNGGVHPEHVPELVKFVEHFIKWHDGEESPIEIGKVKELLAKVKQ